MPSLLTAVYMIFLDGADVMHCLLNILVFCWRHVVKLPRIRFGFLIDVHASTHMYEFCNFCYDP